jgi:thiol-disulfide isomerase/thioredoxin
MNWLKYLTVLGAICVSTISITAKSEIAYPSNYLIIWSADWCPKCPQMQAIGNKLKAEGFDVFTLNFDANRETARRDKISGLPVAIVYTNSEEVKRIIGISMQTAKKVEAQIRGVLKKNKKEPDKKEPDKKEPNDYDIY